MFNQIMYLFPTAIEGDDFRLQDDGNGVYINYWNTAKLGAEPTEEQIFAVTEVSNTPIPPTKDDIWLKIKIERDRRIQAGGYKVGTKWYHSDTFSRTQQMGLVMMGANIPANTPWKTMDGTFVVMTQTLAGQIFGTAAASDIAIFTAAETHNAAMRASATPHTYNYLTGWPTAHGE
jgi:Domain of unknown function (DUF4376)/XkdW protein